MLKYVNVQRIKNDALFILSLTKNMSSNISKNISKNFTSKYNQKLIDHTKHSSTNALKTASKRALQKTPEATGDLIGNKIPGKITKVSNISLENSLKAVRNEIENMELDRELPRERYTSLEKMQKFIDDLRLT